MTSRREFVHALAASALAAPAFRSFEPLLAPPLPVLGVQLYTVRESMRADVDRWMADLPASARPIPLDAYRSHVNQLLKECEITVSWRQPFEMPRGAAAYAETRRRHIVASEVRLIGKEANRVDVDQPGDAAADYGASDAARSSSKKSRG